MQVKYLSALKTKYASYGLSKEALDRVASQRVKTIANEDEIDGDIASFDTALLIMKEMQGATDALRSSNARIQKELDDFKKPQVQAEQEENPFAAEVAELKALLLGMQGKMAETEKKARYEAVIKGAHTHMKSMGCTNDYIREATLKGIELGDDDTAESVAAKYKSAYDENCKKAFGDGYVPPKGDKAGASGEVNYASMIASLKESGAIPSK